MSTTELHEQYGNEEESVSTCHQVGRGVDGLGSLCLLVEGLHGVLLFDQKCKVEEILHSL